MANRYWVGGTGNWTDNTNHWSESSGGSPGASLPNSLDDVFFDVNSFTATNQAVTINSTANCKNMDWTGVLYNPTLTGASNITIYGSLIFSSNMTAANGGSIIFSSTTTGNIINTNGVEIRGATLNFDGVGGEWTLQNDIANGTVDTRKNIVIVNGTFNTNGYNVWTRAFSSSNSNTRTINITNSTITLTSTGGTWWDLGTTTNLTFISTGSTIIYNGSSSGRNFIGGSLTYYNVEFYRAARISGNNTFNNLTFHYDSGSPNSYYFTNGSIQTINTFSGDGTEGNLIPLRSTVTGYTYTISVASGTIEKQYYSIQDCIATGGATFIAINSENLGNNTGWIFKFAKSFQAIVKASTNIYKKKDMLIQVPVKIETNFLKQISKEMKIPVKIATNITKPINKVIQAIVKITTNKINFINKHTNVLAKTSFKPFKSMPKNFITTINTHSQFSKQPQKTFVSTIKINTTFFKLPNKIINIVVKTIVNKKRSIVKSFISTVKVALQNFPVLPWKQTFPSLSYIEYPVFMEVDGLPISGGTITLKGTFPTIAGDLTNLQNVIVKVYDSGRTLLQTITDVTYVSTGVYTVLYTIPEDKFGQFDYEFHGTLGNKSIVGRSSFESNWK